MGNTNHELRAQYPDFFGGEAIQSTRPKHFVLRDLIPIAVIAMMFLAIAWTTGYVKPREKIQNLETKISQATKTYNTRVRMVFELINSLKERTAALETTRYNEEIDELEDRIVAMSNTKPVREVIENRWEAVLEFAQLSKDIVRERDFWALGMIDSAEDEDSSIDINQAVVGMIANPSIGFGRYNTREQIGYGGVADDIIYKGMESIRFLEDNYYRLTPDEQRAKELMPEFLSFSLPRFERDVLRIVFGELVVKNKAALALWKDLREMDLDVAGREFKIAEKMRNDAAEFERLREEEAVRKAAEAAVKMNLEAESKQEVVTEDSSQIGVDETEIVEPDTAAAAVAEAEAKAKAEKEARIRAEKRRQAAAAAARELAEKKRKAAQLLD